MERSLRTSRTTVTTITSIVPSVADSDEEVRAVFMTLASVEGVGGMYQHTFNGSFSAVSNPICVSNFKYGCVKICRDLNVFHTVAPLQN